jgi:uncharacterized protein
MSSGAESLAQELSRTFGVISLVPKKVRNSLLARALLTRRGLTALALALPTCAVLLLCSTRLRFESGFRAMLAAAAEARAGSALHSEFPERTDIVVLVEGDVLAPESLARLRAAQRALALLELEPVEARTIAPSSAQAQTEPAEVGGERIAFDRLESILDARQFSTDAGEIRVTPILTADVRPTGEQHQALLEASRLRPLLDASGRHAALLLSAPRLTDAQTVRLCRAVASTLDRFSSPTLRFTALGVPVLIADLTTLLMRDMQILFGIALLGCVVILGFAFRHPLAVIAPLLVIGLSTVWTFGVMAVFDVPVTIIMLYLPAFLTCVAVGDSVHIQNAYQRQRLAGSGNTEAILEALRGTARPIVYTALTTSCGLLGLCAASTTALRQLGIFASVGITFAMAFSFVLVPLVLSFHRGPLLGPAGRGHPAGDDRLSRFLLRASALTAPHHPRARLRLYATLGSLLLLCAAGLVGVTRLRVQHDTLEWLPRESALRDAVARFDRHLGGAVAIQLVIEAAGSQGVRDGALLARLDTLRARLLAYDEGRSGPRLVSSAVGIGQALDEVAKVLGPEGLAKPWSEGATRDLFTLLELMEPSTLGRFVSPDSNQTLLNLQLRWTHATAYEPFLSHARAAVAATLGPHARTRLMGLGHDMVAFMSSLLVDLQGSFALAFLLEAATLSLFLRGFRLGLIALLPNLLPVLLVLGMMGFAGMSVDVHTLLLAPIALGVVTDDTAHFMYSVRREIAELGDVERALHDTLQHVGRSIVINGATLMAGFGVYLAASMQSMQKLAVLVMLTIALSLLADLVFTPALVRFAFRRRAAAATEASPASEQLVS